MLCYFFLICCLSLYNIGHAEESRNDLKYDVIIWDYKN